jgi:hypothetical protein
VSRKRKRIDTVKVTNKRSKNKLLKQTLELEMGIYDIPEIESLLDIMINDI